LHLTTLAALFSISGVECLMTIGRCDFSLYFQQLSALSSVQLRESCQSTDKRSQTVEGQDFFIFHIFELIKSLRWKAMDFDEILKDVGEFGRYQQLLLIFIILPACLPGAFHGFSQVLFRIFGLG
jgi:hypothetical protein